MKRILVILMCFFLLACERHVLLQENSGKTLELKKGERFQIDLPENPSTGYSWEFLTEPKKSNVVREEKSEYISKKGPMLGAGGRKIFTYTATEKGKVELRGFYKRNYENIFYLDAMGDPRVRYTIIVNEK